MGPFSRLRQKAHPHVFACYFVVIRIRNIQQKKQDIDVKVNAKLMKYIHSSKMALCLENIHLYHHLIGILTHFVSCVIEILKN